MKKWMIGWSPNTYIIPYNNNLHTRTLSYTAQDNNEKKRIEGTGAVYNARKYSPYREL